MYFIEGKRKERKTMPKLLKELVQGAPYLFMIYVVPPVVVGTYIYGFGYVAYKVVRCMTC